MFRLFRAKKSLTRKERTEQFLQEAGIKINYNLPNIESEEDTTLRSPKEIAQRVTVLTVTNGVAFDATTGEKAIQYLKDFNLWAFVTPDEREFLENPTEQRKTQETWKCECIWTLLWALNLIDDLGFPNTMCDLNAIPEENYPLAFQDPNEFIKGITSLRSVREILDANDMYYRMDWAVVDARLNGKEVENLISGVVYERHYALNWLVNYMGQEWDDISTDT